MNVEIEQIGKDKKELVLIRCHEITEEVQEIEAFIKSRQGSLTGSKESRQYEVPVVDVYYIESVDGRTFLNTKEQVFETSLRLYELEQRMAARHFLRVSRSTLLNLMKIRSIQPAMNGRLIALLPSGEKIVISRSYVKGLKEVLRGESS